MTFKTPQKPKSKTYIQISILVLFAFSSAFFSRVLELIKFPSIINLVHYGIIPAICLFTLIKTRVKNRQQIFITYQLLIAIILFFLINVVSAFYNNAGLINACLNFLFFAEHFLLVLAIVCLPLTVKKLKLFRAYIIFSSLINIIFAYIQFYVLQLQYHHGLNDNIKGVFVGGGAGHVVGASVALTFSLYYFAAAKTLPIWFRVFMVLAAFWHMNMADAKQVILALGVAGIILLFTKLNNPIEAIKLIGGGVILGYIFWWAVQNVEALDAFNTWMRPEIYGPEGEATLLKSATFRIVPEYYNSPLHPWIGLGPGHTVGRLGGWMLAQYSSLLAPLGSTQHPASGAVWQAVGASWLGDQSSMFSPLFGWAGIWGDLGWLGLASFLYIWWVVWNRLCVDDVSRYIALTPMVFGLIFTQMEEPGYMLYIGCIIALRWQEHHVRKQRAKLGNTVPPPSLEEIKHPKTPKDWLKKILLLDAP
ncbi:hypothetical protein PN462_22590 [Spirulina sp. CS-785/01]|uniref:hypothetical protein n=1 Tax=Spirulina sp. CS-785/01 TaxID=3021716 RepID=UPI00232ECEEA|nr:hypothetical protein [Spirulina sp. CS-785/01]MDB9315918.1 hypothetical protein [Spirulina sp. CS-785/01]